jgi:hypothetical protein
MYHSPRDLVSSIASPTPTAEVVFDSINTSSNPGDAAFEIQMLLLDMVAEFPESHETTIKHLFSIRGIPPSQNSTMTSLASIHREYFDSLSGRQYAWNSEDKQAPTTPGDRWVSYNVFTVKLAKYGFDDGYFILGFFCLREALKRNRQSRKSEFEKHIRPTSLNHSTITAGELMNYDIPAAVKWAFVGDLRCTDWETHRLAKFGRRVWRCRGTFRMENPDCREDGGFCGNKSSIT